MTQAQYDLLIAMLGKAILTEPNPETKDEMYKVLKVILSKSSDLKD